MAYCGTVTVYCDVEQKWFDERKVKEILNIEEDFDGRDILTFKCPTCGKTHKSFRRG